MAQTNEASRAAPGDERTRDRTSESKVAGAKQGGTQGVKPGGEGVEAINMRRSRFANALGEAVLQRWAELSQETQRMLFEQAVVCGHHDERDESLREQMAEYLHDHHPKTDN